MTQALPQTLQRRLKMLPQLQVRRSRVREQDSCLVHPPQLQCWSCPRENRQLRSQSNLKLHGPLMHQQRQPTIRLGHPASHLQTEATRQRQRWYVPRREAWSPLAGSMSSEPMLTLRQQERLLEASTPSEESQQQLHRRAEGCRRASLLRIEGPLPRRQQPRWKPQQQQTVCLQCEQSQASETWRRRRRRRHWQQPLGWSAQLRPGGGTQARLQQHWQGLPRLLVLQSLASREMRRWKQRASKLQYGYSQLHAHPLPSVTLGALSAQGHPR